MTGWVEIAMLLAACAAAGGLLGVAMGALGVGGGGLAVALTSELLAAAGVGGEETLRVALGTALAAVAALSLRAALARRRTGEFDAASLWRFAAPVGVGGACGGVWAALASPAGVSLGVGLALCASGFVMAFDDARPIRRPKPLGVAAGGVAVGALTAAGALGGGGLGAPALARLGERPPVAQAVAAGLGALACGLGAVALAALGPPAPTAFSIGAVYLPGAAAIAVAAGLAAPLGSRLGAMAPRRAVRGFGAFLLIVFGLAFVQAAFA